MIWECEGAGIGGQKLVDAIYSCVANDIGRAKKVLLIPPDITRMHSRAGEITSRLYSLFEAAGTRCDVLIALGTHMPMEPEELEIMFPGIPPEKCVPHDWRNEVTTLGEIPSSFINEVSGGAVNYPIKAQVNSRIVNGDYDAIYCLGQVVPHEVAGFSSYSKHVLIGCGGWDFINRSHFLGAAVGAENIMGIRANPVRIVFDHAQREFLDKLPLNYIMTVIGPDALPGHVNGLYCGRGEEFKAATAMSAKLNMNHLDRQIDTCVVYLDPSEYRSTWLGNKAVYRTRKALKPGARLIVLAGGVRMFGEDAANNALIEKYGYCGREQVLQLVRENEDLRENLSVAAHLIHGSSDGNFSISYAVDSVNIDPERVRAVGYKALNYEVACRMYPVDNMTEGFQTINGENVFFISNPALGLWACG